jgi:hypothetical protein
MLLFKLKSKKYNVFMRLIGEKKQVLITKLIIPSSCMYLEENIKRNPERYLL